MRLATTRRPVHRGLYLCALGSKGLLWGGTNVVLHLLSPSSTAFRSASMYPRRGDRSGQLCSDFPSAVHLEGCHIRGGVAAALLLISTRSLGRPHLLWCPPIGRNMILEATVCAAGTGSGEVMEVQSVNRRQQPRISTFAGSTRGRCLLSNPLPVVGRGSHYWMG